MTKLFTESFTTSLSTEIIIFPSEENFEFLAIEIVWGVGKNFNMVNCFYGYLKKRLNKLTNLKIAFLFKLF